MGKHNRQTQVKIARWAVGVIALAILLVTGIFFFTYDATVEPAPPVVPQLKVAVIT